MMQASLLPMLYDAHATGGWTAGMVRVTLAMLAGVAMRPGAVVLEVGCGMGAVANALQEAYPAARVTGVELHPLALGGVRANGRPAFVQGNLLQLPFAAQSAQLLLALDSFDQVGVDLGQALGEARRVLLPGGLLLLRVSAHPGLQGAHDVAFNTGRRYTRAEVVDALAREGYSIKRISYANLLLAPPVVAQRLLNRRRGDNAPLSHTALSIYGAGAANTAVHAALTLESLWLRRANLPTGLSLLLLAEKRGVDG